MGPHHSLLPRESCDAKGHHQALSGLSPCKCFNIAPNSPNTERSFFLQGSLIWFSPWEKGCLCHGLGFVCGDGHGLVITAPSSLWG